MDGQTDYIKCRPKGSAIKQSNGNTRIFQSSFIAKIHIARATWYILITLNIHMNIKIPSHWHAVVTIEDSQQAAEYN